MNHSLIVLLLQISKWAAILLCGYAVILGGISLFGLIFNTFKFLFKKDKFFRYFYLVKFLIAGAVAYTYYYLYQYKGLTASVFMSDPPKMTIILLVVLCLPMALLMALDHFLLNEPVRN